MADPALDSHPDYYDLLPDWGRYSTSTPEAFDARRKYVAQQLDIAIKAGIAPLHAIMCCPFADQQDEGVLALRSKLTTVTLRLMEGAVPPKSGPDGRLVEEDLRGKVLRAKLGNKPFATGVERQSREREGLMLTIDVGADLVPLSIDDAVKVWRAWGYRFAQNAERWLVVQVQSNGKPFAPVVAPEPKGKQRAA